MANLDSRPKRASSVGLLLAPTLAPPLPDGTLDLRDRYQIAWSYAGLLTVPVSDIDTANKRFSMLGFCDSINASLPIPNGTLDAGDRMQFLSIYRGLFDTVVIPPGGDAGSPGGTDWFVTEIGRWVRGLTTQFDGHPTLARWKAEAEAAAIAGAPYPWFTSELQRRFLDYFISVQ